MAFIIWFVCLFISRLDFGGGFGCFLFVYFLGFFCLFWLVFCFLLCRKYLPFLILAAPYKNDNLGHGSLTQHQCFVGADTQNFCNF